MAPYRDESKTLEITVENIDKKVDAIKSYSDAQMKKDEQFGPFRLIRAALAYMTIGLETAKEKSRQYEFKGELFMVMHWLFMIFMAGAVMWILGRTACASYDANQEVINQHQEQADRHYCEPACAVIHAQYVTRNHTCIHTRHTSSDSDHSSDSTCDSTYTDVCSCTRDGRFYMINPESGMIRERVPYVAPDMPQESH